MNTFLNQRGIKLVRYDPHVHDELLADVEDWCRGHVSKEKLDEVLDVYRKRKGVEVQGEAQVKNRVGLEIHLATAIDEKALKVVGIVAWARYDKFDYLYEDASTLASRALTHLNVDEFREKMGCTKEAFSKLKSNQKDKITAEKLFEDDDFALFDQFPPDEKEVADLLILCVDPDAKKKGIGRAMLAKCLQRAQKKYSKVLINLGKNNGVVNDAMKDLAEDAGFIKIGAKFNREDLGVEMEDFKDVNGDDEVFMLMEVGDDDPGFAFFQDFLDLAKGEIGTVSCTHNKPEDFDYAPNGARYIAKTEEDDWASFCGANKGYTNPTAGNYST
jgi:GNAT superfamily N-acetyltransferase